MSEPPRSSSSRHPIINAPPIVLATIALLAAIHAALQFLGEDWQIWSLYALSFIPVRLGGGPTIPMPEGAQAWSFVTYALLHGDWMHLIFNCLWLLIFGTPVARYCGTSGYLLIAVVSAIGGAVATLALHWGEFLTLIGASGSVSGLLGAAIPIMYGRSGRALTARELLNDPRAMMFMAIWLGFSLVTGAFGVGGSPYQGLNIAWEAHLGGFIAGLIFYFLISPNSLRWK